MKKTIAIFMAMLMLFSFAACGNKTETTETTNPDVTEVAGNVTAEKETVTFVDENGEVVVADTTEVSEETTAPEVTMPSDDPSTWTTEQIVEFYKAAALNSKSQKSVEKKNLAEMVVKDGDGWLKKLVEWVTPILVFALEKSESEFDGTTGKPEAIVPEDVQSAKAYKSGNYTVIEMKLKEQVDGPHGDRYSGTVGHSISVLGDISEVSEALGDKLFIDFDNATLTLRYTNPTVKVKINDKGIIEKGTWSYTIDVQVANLYVAAVRLPFSATVESAYGYVDYIVEMGGGF